MTVNQATEKPIQETTLNYSYLVLFLTDTITTRYLINWVHKVKLHIDIFVDITDVRRPD